MPIFSKIMHSNEKIVMVIQRMNHCSGRGQNVTSHTGSTRSQTTMTSQADFRRHVLQNHVPAGQRLAEPSHVMMTTQLTSAASAACHFSLFCSLTK